MAAVAAKGARAALRRLLLFLSGGPAVIEGEGKGDDPISMRRGANDPRSIPSVLVRAAVSAGLVAIEGDRVELAEAGRSWLRRALADGETDFAAQHRWTEKTTREVEGVASRVTHNLNESPLAALGRIKARDGTRFLSPAELTAGERLRADFAKAGLEPSVTSNWDRLGTGAGRSTGGGGAGDLGDAAIAARRRIDRAISAVGPELSGVLIDVCCFLKGIEAVERERQWPVRSGKLMLRAALSALARHYGLSAEPGNGSRGVHRWGGENYRPDMTGWNDAR